MGLWTYQLENKIHQWWPWASRSEYLRPQYLQTAGWSPSRHIYSIGCPSAGSLPVANQTESLKWNLWKSEMTWEFAKKQNGSNIDDWLVRTKCAQLCNWNKAKLANKGEKLKTSFTSDNSSINFNYRNFTDELHGRLLVSTLFTMSKNRSKTLDWLSILQIWLKTMAFNAR